MKKSKLSPSWIQGIFEEMNASQANNMLGQVASQHLKLYLKENKSAKAKIQKFLTDVVNGAKLQFADEKPTMIWLIRQIGLANGINVARLEEDKEQITKDIIKFYKYRKELSIKLNDISYSKMKIKLNELAANEELQTLTDFLSKPDIKGNIFSVYIVSDPKIASKIAKGTSWCTQNEGTAARYIEESPLYVFYKGNSRFAQMHFTSLQFMDVNDVSLTPEAMSDIKNDIGEQIYNKLKDDIKYETASYIFKSEISKDEFIHFFNENGSDETIQYLNVPEDVKSIYIYEKLINTNTREDEISFEKIQGKIKIIIKDINVFIDFFENDYTKDPFFKLNRDFIKKILNGDFYDNYTDIDEYIISYINNENKKTLFKYLKREGELEEYEEDNIDDIPNKKFFKAIKNTDIYSDINGVYSDTYNNAYYDACYKKITEAIKDAGFIDNEDGSWYAYIPIDWAMKIIYLRKVDFLKCMFNGVFYSYNEIERLFKLNDPNFDNVYVDIDKQLFNEQLSEKLDDIIEIDVEHQKRREKEEGQGMLFEEYMKRV